MEIGEKYKHRFNPAFACEIVALTNRGAKVKQHQLIYASKSGTIGRTVKTITAYYDSLDFTKERGIWVKKQKTPQIIFNQKEMSWQIIDTEIIIKRETIAEQTRFHVYNRSKLHSSVYFFDEAAEVANNIIEEQYSNLKPAIKTSLQFSDTTNLLQTSIYSHFNKQ